MARLGMDYLPAKTVEPPVTPEAEERFLTAVARVNPNADLEAIRKAFRFAKEAHEGQTRKSGMPYFSHVLAVAYILLDIKPGTTTLQAALLHDVLEDTSVTREDLAREFGEEVARIVEAVTKIERLDRNVAAVETLRKIILAMAKDIRVIYVKLADRLHNMRTLKYLSREKRVKIARETLDIYVPIAYKLGMYTVKNELEDLSFRYLHPEAYREIKEKIALRQEEREARVQAAVEHVQKLLAERGIEAHVYGRAKHFYSIWRKMQRKGRSLDELDDLYAIRIITQRVEDCYRILGIVHDAFTPVPGAMDDYIANPKPNGYRSLHTVVMFQGERLEVQIRTWEMHYDAEYGVAAHWRYKGSERDKEFDKRLEWLKQILEWEHQHAEAFLEDVKVDLFQDEIVVFTPKGDPIFLPEGATPVDFAYAVHTEVGNHCARARVNGTLVSLDHELEPGDVVEIITNKQARPSRAWLQFVKTGKARQRIKSALRIESDRESREDAAQSLQEEDILGMIENPTRRALRLAKCCQPLPGREIVGIPTKDGKLSVHTADCSTLQQLPRAQWERHVKLAWKPQQRRLHQLLVEVEDKVGMLADVLSTVAGFGVNVRHIHTKRGRKGVLIYLDMQAEDWQLERLKAGLRSLPGVLNVHPLRRRSFFR